MLTHWGRSEKRLMMVEGELKREKTATETQWDKYAGEKLGLR